MEIIIIIILVIAIIAGILVSIENSKNKQAMEGMVSYKSPADARKESARIATEIAQSYKFESERALAEYEEGKLSAKDYVEKITGLNDKITSAKNPAPDPALFTATKKFISGGKSVGISIDQQRNKVALLSPYSKSIVNASQLISVEICVDSDTLIHTSKTSLIGGAAIGGLLTGGFGAVVMALGAKKKQESKVKSVELKILMSGTSTPIHRISFFDLRDSGSASSALREVSEWHDLLTVMIREAAHGEKAQHGPQATQTARPHSLSDELEKLNALFLEGVISADELQRAKDKLL